MRETICFRVLPLHLQCFRCAGAQHSCSLQEFQCFDSSSHKPQTATQQHEETSRAPRFEPYGNMWLWIYLKVKWHEQSPSRCRVVNSSRSYLEKVLPVHAAGCRGTHWATEHLSKGLFCVALQVFTCIADFTRLLEHKDTERAAPTQRSVHTAAFCFPKPHRVATEKDQSSHCGNSETSAAHSVAWELYCSLQLPEGRTL